MPSILANKVVRWEGTPAVNYVRIDNDIDPTVDGTYPAEQSCQYFTVLVVECRNVVVNGWELRSNFNIVSGGETFPEVDLMDGFYSNARTDGTVVDVSYTVTDVVLMDP